MDGPIAFFRSLAVERGVKAAVTNSLPLGRMRKKFIGPVRVKSQDYRSALDTNYCHLATMLIMVFGAHSKVLYFTLFC